jgi:hypothetical protein
VPNPPLHVKSTRTFVVEGFNGGVAQAHGPLRKHTFDINAALEDASGGHVPPLGTLVKNVSPNIEWDACRPGPERVTAAYQ